MYQRKGYWFTPEQRMACWDLIRMRIMIFGLLHKTKILKNDTF